MTALYIILIILSVVMLLHLIPADCVINVSCNGGENNGAVIIKYGFVTFKIYPREKKEAAAKEMTKEEEAEEKERDTASLLKLIKAVYDELWDDILKLVKHLVGKTIRIKELNVSSRYGTGDPMYTGIVTGAVNAAVYNAVSAADRHMQLDKWNVSLDADFDNACLSAGIYIKIRTRLLFVVKIGIMAAAVLLKIQKISRRIRKDVRE